MDIAKDADIIVVGCGFYGATFAECAAREKGLKILVIEMRDHIGGNAFSQKDDSTGIEIHRYGPHIFHTSNEIVWNYLNGFTSFTNYQHRAFTVHKQNVFSLPINLGTICQFFGRHFSPEEARSLIALQTENLAGTDPHNLEEKAISMIGRPLYEAFIRNYTQKQWQTDPRLLPAAIFNRLPVRYNFDNRYFSDRFEGMPSDGYTAVVQRMLSSPNIKVMLDTDWFEIRSLMPQNKPVIYTGPIDRYFNFDLGRLGWRTTDFEKIIAPVSDFQGCSIMNYADLDTEYTRIVEYRHFHPERNYQTEKSVIVREYPRSATAKDEPYYPIDTQDDKRIYLQYKKRSELEANTYFGGRLGTYRYIDIHQAVAAALKDWQSLSVRHFGRS